ncbi:hypothetical protein [Pseudomonas abietaniphila]|uniref:Phage integrase family protein n=1 Tax=Pseudomonas abietaniphila TaxID=89065 RepID=A0A1G8SVQ6_9PSED|nr:hypothetical protein [Pseudomonas abietaniphila]SDJ32815.1 hypothetical protein SAMN05216605_12656 [Pseudomonas abietaniphila]
MSLFSACLQLEQLVSDNDWADIPEQFVTREGRLAIINEGAWYLPCETQSGRINTIRFGSPILQWVATKYMIHLAQTTSSIHALNSINQTFALLNHRNFFMRSTYCFDPDLLKLALIEQMRIMIAQVKKDRNLWTAYRPVRWYIWGAETYPELGFCEEYASELDAIKIPGGPKGEAVRSQDPEQGPLHPHLEMSLITNALRTDKGTEFEHYQQRAAIALCKSYGRNCANFIALREEDMFDAVEDPEEPEWMLKIPRIKKGFRSARSDFLLEPMDDDVRTHVQALITRNQTFESLVEVNDKLIPCARPLFRRLDANHERLQVGDYESAYHIYTTHFGKLLRDFATRMGLFSPITQQPMLLSARRFRYTVGTTYAAMGVSRKELARRLDHSDLQHVQVYYDILDVLTYALDKAAVLEYSRFVRLFLGGSAVHDLSDIEPQRLIITDAHSHPGDVASVGACGLDALCHKYPPWSCYLCPKFHPYKSPIHEYILEFLVRAHNERPESQTIGVHRVDVILAVGQVVRMCEESA